MAQRVAILGGGVGGLSAAHELIERGFTVDVYEQRAAVGGKARGIPVDGSGTGGRPELPGEHGFRFFPGFYKHLPDTMKRIPFAGNARGVFDNLVQAREYLIAANSRTDLTFLVRFPTGIDDLRESSAEQDASSDAASRSAQIPRSLCHISKSKRDRGLTRF